MHTPDETEETELTRQQFCARLGISESTVRRLELMGLPFIPVGKRSKRYNLSEAKAWLRSNQGLCQQRQTDVSTSALDSAENAFAEACQKVRLRVEPSA